MWSETYLIDCRGVLSTLPTAPPFLAFSKILIRCRSSTQLLITSCCDCDDCDDASQPPFLSVLTMAPTTGKRVKGVQIFRPFIYGTTARPFDPATNPKPPGVPDDHTHSWTVFVKGVDDVDITYWLRRVQFKLHESIPNHVRSK